MPFRKLIAGVGAALLFATGVAAAALADPPPTTTTTSTDTTTTTTTTTSTTTASTTTSTTTSTSTESTPRPTTTTTDETSTTRSTTTSTTRSTTSPSPRSTPTPQGLRRATGGATAQQKAVAADQRKKKRRKHKRASKPLKVTPPLGQRTFVFPIVGAASYGDSYGDVRSDVRGGWHHGDDIFAPLGTPVVAVASGTSNRVGWERIGGWRLWVRDSAGDEFYYAHLSGYTRSVFHSPRVRAGQVIGFVGNTGDAFGGVAHLHFEIHPRQLLRLRYDGAVDPTTYLESWSHLQHVRAPLPVHPRLPKQPQLRSEARQVFRQLLVARHLLEPPAKPSAPLRAGARVAADPSVRSAEALPLHEKSATTTPAADTSLTVPLIAGASALALFWVATLVVVLRRRRAQQPA